MLADPAPEGALADERGEPLGIAVPGGEHREALRRPPPERRCQPVDVLSCSRHDGAHQRGLLALALAGVVGLLACVALDGLGRELVDVGEDCLGEQRLGAAVNAGGTGGGREAPPCDTRADAVRELERVERASGAQLAAAEREVDLTAGALRRDWVAHLVQELA